MDLSWEWTDLLIFQVGTMDRSFNFPSGNEFAHLPGVHGNAQSYSHMEAKNKLFAEASIFHFHVRMELRVCQA